MRGTYPIYTPERQEELKNTDTKPNGGQNRPGAERENAINP